MSLSFLVPTELAPPIIGPRGSAVRRLVGESGCSSIHLSNNDPSMPDRRVTIRGEADSVGKAFDIIAEVLRAECRKTGRADITRSIRLLVPEAAAIVGDAALAELRSHASVAVEVSARPDPGAPLERVLTIGGDGANMSRAVHRLVGGITERHQQRLSGFFSKWAFTTEYNDHFETPRRAYADILPLLEAIALQAERGRANPDAAGVASRKRKQSHSSACGSGEASSSADALRSLTVWDPYYCKGSMVSDLAALGCSAERVINRNRDFYADIANGETPTTFDALVTNPPYSADHKQRLLEFLLHGRAGAAGGASKGPAVPFLLLMPAWLCDKDYWRAFLRQLAARRDRDRGVGAGAGAADGGAPGETGADEALERAAGVFYVSPRERYVDIYLYLYSYSYSSSYIHTYVCICMYVYIYIFFYIYLYYIYMYIYIHAYIYVWVCMCGCVGVGVQERERESVYLYNYRYRYTYR